MADGRKNNGGNSTKAKGFDKRKNPYKNILNDSCSPEEIKKVVRMLYDKSVSKQDVRAAKLLLEYYLGRPSHDININPDNDFEIPLTKFFGVEAK